MKYPACFIRNISLISTWIINNRLITLLIGVFYCKRLLRQHRGDELKQPARFLESRRVRSINNHTRLPQRTVCVRPPCTNVSTQRTVCDIHTYGNVFLGFTVWDVHTYGNDFLGFTVWDVHTYGNDFLGFTMWDVHTYGNDWVLMPRPIADGPSLGPRRAYPRRFLGHVGRTHLSPTLTW